jgi:spore maturation protein CgeB
LRSNFNNFRHYNGVYGLEHNKIVNETKINLNFSPTDSTGVSVRLYKILASGGFLMTTPWNGIENTFKIDEDIVVFNDENELKEKINFYLNNEDKRNNIRLNGYKKVVEYLPINWAKKIINYCK